MRKIFTFVSAVALALGMQAAAIDTIQVDGIYYQLNDNQTAVVLPAQAPATKYEIDNIVIPVSVAKDEVNYTVVELAKAAFRNATSSSITFAEGSQVTTLGMQCFQAAVNLQELELPEGIRLIPMTGIHNATATNPMQMKKLVLPASIDSIARLSICLPQLKVLEFKGAVPPRINTFTVATSGYTQNPWEINVNNACNTAKSAVVIVPDGALEAYQNTAWIGDYFTTIVEKSNFAEVGTIAEFNEVEDGKTVKLTLTDAKVTAYAYLQNVYYVEDATAATVISGVELTVGTALNGYLIGTKSYNDIDYVNFELKESILNVTDASGITATETTLTPTVMTITEACDMANYAKLITIENVTISGSGNNKTLTDAEENTIKARDLFGVLSQEFTWPAEAASVTGICLYYMTGWFIIPISEEAIVAKEGTDVKNVKTENGKAVKFIENGQLYIRHNGRTYNVLGF